jgi:Uma2 family endonuclease
MSVRAKRWNRQEYESLVAAGAFAPNTHVQLIDGEIVEMTPQSRAHAVATRAVEEGLRIAFPAGYDIQVQMPLALGEAAEPEPDVAVVPGSFRDYRDAHPEHAVLIVEVADTSLEFDRTRKAELYARTRIPEYWIVNLVDRRLEVFRGPQASRYEIQLTLNADDSVSPIIEPEMRLHVASLLP